MNLRWWHGPLLALQLLTRIPVPGLSGLKPDDVTTGLVRAVCWFPFAGGIVGMFSAGVLICADHLWPRIIAVILMLIAEARLTGAFHEDAVADFCDGFGGGQTAHRIHEIMKDSRVGAYGVTGLILALALRGALLCALPLAILLPALAASAAFGRWLAVAQQALLPSPPGITGMASAIVDGTGLRHLAIASMAGLPFIAPFAWLYPAAALAAAAASAVFMLWLRRFLMRHLGGVTGDCLGFAVYAGQLIVLLAAAAAW